MSFFNYFNTDTAKLFGVAMAQSYIEQMSTKRKIDDRKLAALSLRAVEKIEFKIKDFKKSNKLNFYKVAQAANAFKWEMKDAGYDEAQVDKLTEWFVIKLKS